MKRGYQLGYSNISAEEMYDVETRERKAATMVSVLSDCLDRPLSELSMLNVGGSTGIIDNYLAEHFGKVTSVDIDELAITHAREKFQRENLHYQVGDAMNLAFDDASFDVVISSHIYEHVPDAGVMMNEIHRVLKQDGVCYFAGCNRIMWNEPHYNLPLLSVIPTFMAHAYVRLFRGQDHYYERHLSYWGLKRLVNAFRVEDYTRKTVTEQERFGTAYMLAEGSLKARIADWITGYAMWLSPGYIWILHKKQPGNNS